MPQSLPRLYQLRKECTDRIHARQRAQARGQDIRPWMLPYDEALLKDLDAEIERRESVEQRRMAAAG